MLKYELVKRKVDELKPDLNQPRKSFKKEDIKLLAQTYQSQGIINPIEIDAENVIITGELRWRAAKVAKVKEIECKLFEGLDETKRFERQTIENLHHNILTSVERENAVKKLWESKNYETKQELANILGIHRSKVTNILRAHKTRKELKLLNNLSTYDLEKISGLKNKEDRKKLAQKLEKKEVKSQDLSKIVKTIKEVEKKAPELKKEILKPESKITRERIEEIKEVAKLPKDIQKPTLKKDITIEEAKEVAEFPEPEQRKEIIRLKKQVKKAGKKIIEQKKDIVKKRTKPPITIENLDEKFIRVWRKIEQDIKIKMRKGFLQPYGEGTRKECSRIVKSIVDYLIKEFSEEVKVIGA